MSNSEPLDSTVTLKGEQLCQSCYRLELSIDKFLIDNSDYAGLMQQPMLITRPKATITKLNSGHGPKSMGTLEDIMTRNNCALCQLVHKSIDRYSSGMAVVSSSECFMEWEVDGRKSRQGGNDSHRSDGKSSQCYSNSTRRIRFWWTLNNGKIQEAYIMFVPPRNRILPSADTTTLRARGVQFLARDYDRTTSIQAEIKSWFDLCQRRHSGACKSCGDLNRLRALQKSTSFGVIDVVRMQLCQLPLAKGRPAPYVALSYVWGHSNAEPEYTTRRCNIITRIKPGGIEPTSLPRTVQDAIQLTRDLGERYLWVDAVCIVQDSPSSWKMNAANMDLVYGSADLTICAADGDSANEGLVALDSAKMDTPLRAEYTTGVKLLVSRPSDTVINASTWNQRAWTFQERILSRRCLVFAGRRVYFQCRTSNMSQDIYPDESGTGWSSGWKDTPLRTLDELEIRPIWVYMKCVHLYTGRHLTFPQDILNAFAGVARLVEQHMHRIPFVHGLPASHFDLALLWEPLNAQARRTLGKDKQASTDVLALPSWSWAGWMDAQDPSKGAPVKYNQETLDGCFEDVREWLLEHTWIHWFIRNVNGDLRPIWSRDKICDTSSVPSRWRGYAASAKADDDDDDDDNNNDNNNNKTIVVGEIREDASAHSVTSSRSTEETDTISTSDTRPPRLEMVGPTDGQPLWRLPPPPPALLGPPPRFRDGEGEHVQVVDRPLHPSSITGTPNTVTEELDAYGRRPRGPRSAWKPFQKTIPDNPFGVNQLDFEARPQLLDQAILQFWTWREEFHVLRDDSATKGPSSGEGLVRCHVADDNSDLCGYITLNEDWISERNGYKFNFIAISDAKSLSKEEFKNWMLYIPQEREDIEWDLYFVLLVERNNERMVWERVGLGKILKAAFDSAAWEEILLG